MKQVNEEAASSFLSYVARQQNYLSRSAIVDGAEYQSKMGPLPHSWNFNTARAAADR
ncbi:MAG: hypothetical protein ACKESB_02810 [Candidatus Hodgkinia cicadicola]